MTILGLAFFALTGVGLYLGYDALVKKPSEVLTNSVRNAKDVLKTIFAPKGDRKHPDSPEIIKSLGL